jgi:hypothetical protein
MGFLFTICQKLQTIFIYATLDNSCPIFLYIYHIVLLTTILQSKLTKVKFVMYRQEDFLFTILHGDS